MQPGPRRASHDDVLPLSELQHAAYAANRKIIGVEPLPLLVDYADIIRAMDVWLFDVGQSLSGALILQSERDHLLVWSVASLPDMAAKGLGRTMMAFAESEALRQGLMHIRLYTGSKLFDRIRWYQRLGYEIERVEELADRQITHMVKQVALRPSAG